MLTPSLWKIATGGAAVVALGLMVLLGATYFENRDLMKQRDTLSRQINDPKTGYMAQLAQARTNVETLKSEVVRQNQAYSKLSADSQQRLRDSERRLAIAQQATRAMEQRLTIFMATPPQGDTLEERILDVDGRIVQELRK